MLENEHYGRKHYETDQISDRVIQIMDNLQMNVLSLLATTKKWQTADTSLLDN